MDIIQLISNYQIPQTADYIKSKNFTKIVLQFSNELLPISFKIKKELEKMCSADVQFYILCDK